nr:MAG TPA: hypothetical protein [Caudoviricetes sp.]
MKWPENKKKLFVCGEYYISRIKSRINPAKEFLKTL